MTRRLGPKNRALADQVVAVLREADGFPLSTGHIARSLGERFVVFVWHKPSPTDRPACWPEDYADEGLVGNTSCDRCGRRFHRPPVWRQYEAQDVRGLLNNLAKRGEVEKVVLEGDNRVHYWRRDDSDCEVTANG